jgi:hypothetical protein
MSPLQTATLATMSGLLLCMGGFQIVRAWRNHVLVRRSRTWASVPGQTAESYPLADTFWGYLPRVSYWYKVDGMRYTGSRITFGEARQPLWHIEDSRNRYPFGATVTVYYDPKNPQHSALELRAVSPGWSSFMGAVWLSLGVFVAALMVLE